MRKQVCKTQDVFKQLTINSGLGSVKCKEKTQIIFSPVNHQVPLMFHKLQICVTTTIALTNQVLLQA